jgi:hypothetical protein
VRLEPAVQVNGAPARGPTLLLAQAAERYVVTRHVGFFGGPMRLRIDAQTRSLGLAGPVRELRVTTWVIPWHLFALLVIAGGLFVLGRFLLRKRGGKYESIRSDIRRLERMLTLQNGNGNGSEHEPGAEHDDVRSAIRAAIKQARRAGDERTAERLEAKLDESARVSVSPAPWLSGPNPPLPDDTHPE